MKSKLFFLLALIFLTFFLCPSVAEASILSISPSSSTLGIGSSKTFQVRLNTQGEGVNAVSAVIAYPQELLEVISLSAGSAFSIEAEQTFGGGVINISRGNVDSVVGTVTVASITLKGKAAGKATVYFTSGSAAPRASDSSDSLKLAESIGAVIEVGGVGGTSTTVGTKGSSVSEIPQVGSFEQTILILIIGFFLTTAGIVVARIYR